MTWVLIIAAAILCVHAFLQIRLGNGFGGIAPFGSFEGGDFRVCGSGIFNDPNDFAMLFILVTPLVLSLLRLRGVFLSKAFLLCLLPAFVVVLYFTQSRGAVVGFCVMLLGYLWLAGRATITRLVLTSILLAAAVAFGPSRARGTIYEGSSAGRVMAWGVGNQFLKHDPLFGIGYQRWGEFESTVAHNSFVTCYAELGLVGYFFWFALVWIVTKNLRKIARAKNLVGDAVAKLAGGLFAGTLGYFAAAFFLTRTYNPVMYFLLGLGIGFIRVVQNLPNIPRGFLDITARDLRQSLVLSWLSVPAIWLFARYYWASGAG